MFGFNDLICSLQNCIADTSKGGGCTPDCQVVSLWEGREAGREGGREGGKQRGRQGGREGGRGEMKGIKMEGKMKKKK